MTPLEELQLQINTLKRTSRRKTAIIITISIVLAGSLVLLYFSQHIDKDFYGITTIGPNPDPVAGGQVGRFRKRLSFTKKSMGVYYDTSDIRTYVDSIFPALMNEQIAHEKDHPAFDYKRYKWVAGFYWMMKKDADSTYKFDFYFVPTLVDTNKNLPRNVLDYYAKNDTVYYHLSDKANGNPLFTAPGGNSYDEGQLWP